MQFIIVFQAFTTGILSDNLPGFNTVYIVGWHRRFGVSCCFHLQSDGYSSKTSVSTHDTTQCSNPEYLYYLFYLLLYIHLISVLSII
jgi:hypothetical protein